MKIHSDFGMAFIIFLLIIIPNFISAGYGHGSSKFEKATLQQVGGTDWKAPKFAEKLTNPVANNEESTKEGKNLFNKNCASCHGEEGEGNGPAAISINPKPKNLTSDVVQQQSDGAIFWKIATGKGQMVSWQNTFSASQRWALVNYIRWLKKK